MTAKFQDNPSNHILNKLTVLRLLRRRISFGSDVEIRSKVIMFEDMLSHSQIITLLENELLVIAEIATDQPESLTTVENDWIIFEKSTGRVTLLTPQKGGTVLRADTHFFYEGQLFLNAAKAYFLPSHHSKWQVLDSREHDKLSEPHFSILETFLHTTKDTPLFPVTRLPALDFGYEIYESEETDEHSFCLSLIFSFSPADHFRFDPADSEVKNRKEVAIQDAAWILDCYETLLTQIISPDIEVFVTNTLDPQQYCSLTSAKQASGVAEFLTEVINRIQQFIADPEAHNLFESNNTARLSAVPIQYKWNIKQQFANPQKLFPLEVLLVTQRKLKKEKAEVPKVPGENEEENFGMEVLFLPVAPFVFTELYTNDDQNLPLKLKEQFAKQVENILGTSFIKLAVAVPDEITELTDETFTDFWILKMKDLIEDRPQTEPLKLSEQQIYSVAPVSNTLVDLPEAVIYPFEHYLGSPASSLLFYLKDVDYGESIQKFLVSLEIMRQESAMEIYTLIDTLPNATLSNSITRLQQQVCERIADCLLSDLRPVFSIQGDKSIVVLIEKIRKSFEKNLNLASALALAMPLPIKALSYNHEQESYLPVSFSAISTQAQKTSSFGTDSNTRVEIPGLAVANESDQNHFYMVYSDPDFSQITAKIRNTLIVDQVKIVNTHSGADQATAAAMNANPIRLALILPYDTSFSFKLEEAIPVPLIQQPKLPSLLDEGFAFNDLDQEDGKNIITEAFYGGFYIEYQLDRTDERDICQFELKINNPDLALEQVSNKPIVDRQMSNFLNQIHQFNFVSKEFLAYFENEMPKVQQARNEVELASLGNLISKFWNLAEQVALSWPTEIYMREAAAEPIVVPGAKTLNFQVSERASAETDGNLIFESVIAYHSAKKLPIGIISEDYLIQQLEGWTAELQVAPKSSEENTATTVGEAFDRTSVFRYYRESTDEKLYLTFEQAQEILKRRIELSDLYLPEIKNARAAVSLLRNSRLNDQLNTNQSFIYESQKIDFAEASVPYRLVTEDIFLPAAANKQLADYFIEVFELVSGNENADSLSLLIKIQVQLKLTVSEGDAAFVVDTPIISTLPTHLFVAEKINTEYARNISTATINWIANNIPSFDNSTLSLCVDVLNNDSEPPLISFENILIKFSSVEDIRSLY